MTAEVGVFKSRSGAASGIARVLALGVSREKIQALTTGFTRSGYCQCTRIRQRAAGNGPAVGRVVGGATWVAGGFGAEQPSPV